MLEWTAAGAGARLEMLVLHDDAAREYAYGPAAGLLDSKLGTFTQALYDEAKKNGWSVISMKNDWSLYIRVRLTPIRLRCRTTDKLGGEEAYHFRQADFTWRMSA